MKILHITDFHFSSEYPEYDYSQIVEIIIDNCLNDNIEYIFFTGDLVFSGNELDDFFRAKELLITRLSNGLNVNINNIFICPGNHDVHRNQELSVITDVIEKIKDSSSLESFIKKQDGRSFDESLKNLSNYLKFQDDFYDNRNNSPHTKTSMYVIHKFKHNNINIGLMSINTAWRSIDSDKDRGSLLYPISIFKSGISKLNENTDFRILIHHHPISDFQGWNTSELEDLVSINFHISFSGHLHKRKIATHITTDGGILSCSSAATLALDGTINGYSIIDIDLNTYDVTVDFRSFNRADNSIMVNNLPRNMSIPRGAKKDAAISIAKTIRKKTNEELERANELFIFYQDNNLKSSFLELFTEPILKTKSSSELAKDRINIPNTDIVSIIASSDNWLIYGKDKSGKTCILYKFLLGYLSEFSSLKTLPLYIDCNDYRKSTKALDIYKLFNTYYEVNNTYGRNLIKTNNIIVLIDNYDPTIQSFKDELLKFHSENTTIRIIAIAEERLVSKFHSNDLGSIIHKTLYIHELLRTDVRCLTNKWPNISEEKKEKILEKIFQIFSQLNIPINYWTASLFLSIFEKNGDANFHNNFELIQLYIDNLLDRKRLALDKSIKIDFDEFKLYLASLAHFLLVDREATTYSASYKEIVNFTDSYRNVNRRFVIDVEDIINLIKEKGIIRRINDDNYTFRLNGVFEYFLALYMTVDDKFKNQLINDDHFYLSFKNELELYAGFAKNDKIYLDDIFNKTKNIFSDIDGNYSNFDIDLQLITKVSHSNILINPLKQLSKTVQQTLSVEQQDSMMEDIKPNQISYSEVSVKKFYEKIDSTSENLERAIHILARVYRNLKIQNDPKTDEVLDYILDRVCYLGFKLVDEAENNPDFINLSKSGAERGKMLLKIISTFMPLLVQSFLFDAIAQNDFERIFKEKISNLKLNSNHNQFRLFVLYLTLIDIDVNQNYEQITEMLDVITMPLLRQSILLKLYYYLMFKCHSNLKLEKFIQKGIQSLSLELNERVDLGKVHQAIEKSKKIGHYNNSKK